MSRRIVLEIFLITVLLSILGSAFKVQTAEADGTIYIRADGSVEGTDKIKHIDESYIFTGNITECITVERDNILVDGNGYTLEGALPTYFCGIYLRERYNVTIRNLTIKRFSYGVIVSYSTNINISANNIALGHYIGYQSGVYLLGSSRNIVRGNRFSNNIRGIFIVSSSENNISRNEIVENENGIWLEFSSNNSIVENNIASNKNYGIFLFDSFNNSIHHNSFVENSNQIYINAPDNPNAWDNGYPSGGNYWSDYEERYPNAVGLDSSGIWDTPYVIDESNNDRYPLMNPYVDTTPPAISILSPENKTYNANDVPLIFTVNESTSWIGYSLDGQENVTITGNTTIFVSDGAHAMILYANDTEGNMGSSDVVYFTVDTVFSNIEILSPQNKTYSINTVPLDFTVGEATSWIGYSLDGQANETIAGNTTLPELPVGMHNLIVFAKDAAGNAGASEIIYFTIESQATPLWMSWWFWVIIAVIFVAVAGTVIFLKKRKQPTTTPLPPEGTDTVSVTDE